MNMYEVKFKVDKREHIIFMEGVDKSDVKERFNLLWRGMYETAGKVKVIEISKYLIGE